MVQGLSGSKSSINRIGMTESGRAVYQIVAEDGQETGKISIPQKDCDTFEKSYNTMKIAAPKLQRYTMSHSKDEMEKIQKTAKWLTGGGAFIGGIIPMIKVQGAWYKQLAYTVAGTIAGLAAGLFIANSTLTPPGSKEFATAARNLSKIDIQPVVEKSGIK